MEPAAGDLLRGAGDLARDLLEDRLAAGAGDSSRVSARAARAGLDLLGVAAWEESGEEEVRKGRAGDGGLKLGWE
jgi:hypothetical protein